MPAHGCPGDAVGALPALHGPTDNTHLRLSSEPVARGRAGGAGFTLVPVVSFLSPFLSKVGWAAIS